MRTRAVVGVFRELEEGLSAHDRLAPFPLNHSPLNPPCVLDRHKTHLAI